MTAPLAKDLRQWSQVIEALREAIGSGFSPESIRPVSGGSINAAYLLSDGRERFFVKTNAPDREAMFAAEAEGLRAMRQTGAIRVPEPICFGADERFSWLVCEYIEFGRPRQDSEAALGRQLAAMHRHTADRFGWHRDNTIGSTPQINDWCDDWLEFWGERRLRYQADLLAARGMEMRQMIDELCEGLAGLFRGHAPEASLLHGDLWGGNRAFDAQGNPVIFDPAVYYGDREADVAMTELFGGFGPDFYAGYGEAWALDEGYQRRRQLYNLYHIMNHANLFGGGYFRQARAMAASLLGEL